MGEKAVTGWEPDKRTHFDEIVTEYDRVRPAYPDALLADIFAYAGAGGGKNALEIGAGTGKATLPFLDAGYAVTAVEIGANMADFLRERFRNFPDFGVLTANFEEAALEENRYDLLYAASSFHWVDAKIGCPKVFRLLKSGGVFALLRYNFNFHPPEGEELHDELCAVYEKYYYSHYQQARKPVKFTHELLTSPRKVQSGYGFADMQAFGFTDVSMTLYDTTLTYNGEDFITFLDTLSDHRHLPEANREALYKEVKVIIDQNGGHHKLDCIFQLYMGRKPNC